MLRPIAILLAFCVTLQPGCKPKVTPPTHEPNWANDTSTPLSNPLKGISSFVIKAADNPGLPVDVTGVVILDTIKLVFRPGTDVSHLTPTITIVGSSISPASLAPQDFGSSPLYSVTATDGSMFYYRAVALFR